MQCVRNASYIYSVVLFDHKFRQEKIKFDFFQGGKNLRKSFI